MIIDIFHPFRVFKSRQRKRKNISIVLSSQNFDRKRKIISAFGHFYIFLIEKPILKFKAALIYDIRIYIKNVNFRIQCLSY